MSRETEKIIREFQKFTANRSIDTEEELHAALAEFNAQQAVKNASAPGEPDAYDYLDMAYEATSAKKAKAYAQKALELDPNLLDAEHIITSLHAKADDAYQMELEALLEKGERQLREQGITREKNAGDFYAILETRPYLRVYQEYVDLLVAERKIRKAAKACEDILYLNEGDNMGVRYTLMALYALLEEQESCEALYKRYSEKSSFMVLPLIALYYRLDEKAKAAEWMGVLTSQIRGIKSALKELTQMDEDELFDLSEINCYAPRSSEELQVAYANSFYLYGTMPDFLPWLIANLPQKKTAKKK
jgi:hypothetical protein